MGKNRLIIFFWSMVFRKWLKGKTVVYIKGWRTAVVDEVGHSRRTISPCFKLFGFNFD